jgi:hypothetical protein
MGKTIALVVLVMACGSKQPAPATATGSGSAAPAGDKCCCDVPAEGSGKATEVLLSADECKAKNGKCDPAPECKGIEGPIP